MLDSEDIRVLSFLRSRPNGACSWQLLRETFGQGNAFLERLNTLAGEGLVQPERFDYVGFDGEPAFRLTATEYRISVNGRRVLAAEEKLAQEVARQAAQDAAKEATRKAERAEDIRRSKEQFYLGHLFTFLIGVVTGLVVAWVTHLW